VADELLLETSESAYRITFGDGLTLTLPRGPGGASASWDEDEELGDANVYRRFEVHPLPAPTVEMHERAWQEVFTLMESYANDGRAVSATQVVSIMHRALRRNITTKLFPSTSQESPDGPNDDQLQL